MEGRGEGGWRNDAGYTRHHPGGAPTQDQLRAQSERTFLGARKELGLSPSVTPPSPGALDKPPPRRNGGGKRGGERGGIKSGVDVRLSRALRGD